MTIANQDNRPTRWITLAAGLIGAAGMVAAAAASHGADPRLLGAAAAICLANAPALLALGIAGRRLTLGALSAALLTLGTIVFSGDLGLRAHSGTRLFPMAAPIGGTLMIIAWLVVAVSAVLPSRNRA